MPRSANRRSVEIPLALYEQLAVEAAREGTTLSAHLQALLIDGRSMRESYGALAGEIAALRREIRHLSERLPPPAGKT